MADTIDTRDAARTDVAGDGETAPRVGPEAAGQKFIDNPIGEDLLLGALFGGVRPDPLPPGPALKQSPAKPDHYKIVSISLYREDIERLGGMVQELKKRGHYRANKSQVIRHALAQLDLDKIPR